MCKRVGHRDLLYLQYGELIAKRQNFQSIILTQKDPHSIFYTSKTCVLL